MNTHINVFSALMESAWCELTLKHMLSVHSGTLALMLINSCTPKITTNRSYVYLQTNFVTENDESFLNIQCILYSYEIFFSNCYTKDSYFFSSIIQFQPKMHARFRKIRCCLINKSRKYVKCNEQYLGSNSGDVSIVAWWIESKLKKLKGKYGSEF